MLGAGTNSAQLGQIAARRDHELVVPKQLLRAFIRFRLAQIGVAAQLINALPNRIGRIRRFALNDRQRQTIHKTHNIGNDILILPLDFELIRTQEIIIPRHIKINNLDRLPLTPLAQVLLYRHIIDQHLPQRLVVLHQPGMYRVCYVAHHLAQVLIANPGVQTL